MTEGDRKFRTEGGDNISCDLPCEKEFAKEAPPSKSIKIPTFRCVSPHALLRGQHFGPQGVHPNPNICRVCTIYTTIVDNRSFQG